MSQRLQDNSTVRQTREGVYFLCHSLTLEWLEAAFRPLC